MLTEVTDYYDRQRRETSLTTAIINALSFDPTSTYLASGTSAGLLTIHSLVVAAVHSPHTTRDASIVSQHDLSVHGAINALLTSGDYLFIATDTSVHVLEWKNIHNNSTPYHVFKSKSGTVRAFTEIRPNIVVAACIDGTLIKIDAENSADVLHFSCDKTDTKYAPCTIATSPTDRNCILTGCNDGSVRQYDLRRMKGLMRKIDLFPAAFVQSSTPRRRPYQQQEEQQQQQQQRKQSINHHVSALTFNPDGTYVMLATSDRKLSSMHLASETIIKSAHLPFVPQAIVSSASTFYVGGSDRRVGYASTVNNVLHAYDVLCNPLPSAPVSAGAVYSITAHPTRYTIAAAGFTPATSHARTQRLIDVYIDPPIRSFSLSI